MTPNTSVTKVPSRFRYLRGDISGGLMAAIVALPLALAFGVASGLGAQAGLYGAIACGILAGLFGGTPGQVSGPTGPMTVVVAALLAAHTGRPELVFAAIILGGLLQVVLGLIKGGDLIQYIPYPVISGFMSGIGLIIIAVEIPPLFGLDTPANAVEGLQALLQVPGQMNVAALGIGLLTLAIIYLLPRLLRQIPAPLVALVAGTTLAIGLGLEIPLIRDVGAIPQGLPTLTFPLVGVGDIPLIIPAALTLALLGAIDSLLTSVVVDKITHRQHDSNRELMGQGLGNMVAGLIGGLPGAGATMRSVINVQNGGRTSLSAVIHGVILLTILLGLGTIASQIPLTVLAGILITVGISIIDARGLKSIGKAPTDDVIAMLLVLVLTVFLDLITAVLVGLSLATFLFCKRFSDLEISEHGHLDALSHLSNVIHRIPAERLPHIYVYTFNGPLFFGEARNFKQVMFNLPVLETVILQFQNVPLVDQTGAFTLEDAMHRLESQQVRVICVGLSDAMMNRLGRLNIMDKLRGHSCFATLEDALEALAAPSPSPSAL